MTTCRGVLGVACVMILGTAPPAWGQAMAPLVPPPPAGWYVIPSFSVSEEYNSNVFGSTSDERSDFITRFTTGIALGFRSQTLTGEASYSLDSEIYAREGDLNDALATQRVAATVRYVRSPQLTLGLAASYTDTNNPDNLPVLAPDAATPPDLIQLGRRNATLLSIVPRVTYQIDRRTSADASYLLSRSRSAGVTNVTHGLDLSVSHEVTPRDRGTLGYRLRVFDSEGIEVESSHALLAGWSRQLSETLTARASAGPRFSDDGGVDAYAEVGLEQRFRAGLLTLTYIRSDTTVLRESGVQDANSVLLSASFQPFRELRLTGGASFTDTSGDRGRDIRVYQAFVSAAYQVTSWLMARGYYRVSYQDRPDTVTAHVVGIAVELAYPYPLQ